MKQAVIKEADAAKSRMCISTGKSLRTIQRYLDGASNPGQSTCFKLALACGCSEEEALDIASECTFGGQRTA